jgi:sugar phosphate isomerase/epimerase
MIYTRRDVGKIALAALPAGKLLSKPNSNFGGVQIGIILSPTALRGIPLGADEVLKNLVELGISAVEMQDVRVETYAGAPSTARVPASAPVGGQTQRGRAPSTPEQQQAQQKAAEGLRRWRLSASMDKYRGLRKMYADAGVKIYAFRVARIAKDVSDDELAYFFNTAEALGANQITHELPKDTEISQRLGNYAAKRKFVMAYHNHTQVNFNSWDTALAQSKGNGINFDVGHFAAAVSQSPIPFIEKHHDRIASLHLKDRNFGTKGGQNVPWGQGDTPLKEILVMLKRKKYPFPAAIELEYPIPEGSSTMAEISNCLQFSRNALA